MAKARRQGSQVHSGQTRPLVYTESLVSDGGEVRLDREAEILGRGKCTQLHVEGGAI